MNSHLTISTSRAPAVSRIEDREWVDTRPGERASIHVRSEHTQGGYGILEIIVEPDRGVPPHFHGREDEIFLITGGCVSFDCGDGEFEAPSGTTVVVPRGLVHTWHNRAPIPARMIVIFAPGGIERLFEDIVGCSEEEAATIARRFGTVMFDSKTARLGK